MKTKFIALLSIGLVTCSAAFAQVRTDISVRERNNSAYDVGEQGYNAHNFSVGFGLGSSKLYGDWSYSNPQPVYIGYFEKNITPTISYGWTVSVGDLSTRDSYTKLRSFNHFTSVDQHITVELGTLFYAFDKDYYDNLLLRIIGGVYGGTGIGIINSDIKRIANSSFDVPGAVATENPSILTNSTALYIPINAGFNLHVPKFWIFKGCVFNANFQYSSTMSDYIDGYKPPFKANKRNDVYTVASIGFRFFILHPSEY
ncbi:MAG: hypothetical protein K9G49_00430 [Taibaiella sp.]|nr:hypothetical protein [Taibaiella sp.]